MKKNILIAVLLITIILMGGMFFYLYTNQEFDKCSVENSKDNKVSKEQKTQINFDLKNKTIIQALNGDSYTILISKNGEAYLRVYNEQNNEHMRQEVIEHIKKLQEQYTVNTIEGYCNTEGEYKKNACEDNDNVKSIKLDTSNVIAAYDTVNGQDVDSNKVIFVKSDGTIDALNIGSLIWSGQNPKVQKNVGNLKNIVAIVQSSTTGALSGSKYAVAIAANGTQHVLSEYLDY